MNTPTVRERMAGIGTDLVTSDRTTSDYLAHFVVSEIKKWEAPIRASGVSMESCRRNSRLTSRDAEEREPLMLREFAEIEGWR